MVYWQKQRQTASGPRGREMYRGELMRRAAIVGFGGAGYRETYEKYGLKDVADEMEKLGLLPRHPDKRWEDYGEEPYSKFVENWKKDTIVLPPNAK